MREIELGLNSKVYLGYEQKTGRGIYAGEDIYPDRVISYTFSWELSPTDLTHFCSMSIGGFWFAHPDKPGWGLMPLGLGGLVNHSQTPNASLNWFFGDEFGYVGELRTLKGIFKIEQLRIDYGIPTKSGWKL